jgi:hypothetical protein
MELAKESSDTDLAHGDGGGGGGAMVVETRLFAFGGREKGPPLHAVGCTRNKRRVNGNGPVQVAAAGGGGDGGTNLAVYHHSPHGKKWLRRRRLDASRCVTIYAWLESTRFHPLHHGETAIQPSS